MAWQTNTGGQGPSKIVLDVDADGLGTAKTWGVDRVVGSTNVGGFDRIPAQPNRSIDANVGLAFDREHEQLDARAALHRLHGRERQRVERHERDAAVLGQPGDELELAAAR